MLLLLLLLLLLLIWVNVGFTEVVPTVGGERELVPNCYTVSTRLISALRWANI